MLRNLEIRNFLLVMGLIALVATAIGAMSSLFSAILIFITSALLMGCSLFFTRWRYREIEKLSGYLRKIVAGNYSLDVRDNHEGELSILKKKFTKLLRCCQNRKTFYSKIRSS